MKIKILFQTWIFILLCWCIFPAKTVLAQSPKIFILHSYHQEYPWTKNENDGFTQTLSNKFPDANLSFSTEYLDTKRVKFNKKYQEFYFHYLKQKYALYSPDVIFCSDDNALIFLLQFKERLFGDVPVVFCGVNDLNIENDLNRQQHTGVFEKKEIIPNLTLLKKISPQTNNIIFLGDDSSTHNAIEKNIRDDIASQFPKQKFTFLSSNSQPSLINQLKLHKEGVIFLTTVGGIKDKQEVILPLKNTIASIVRAGNFTIISMEDVYMEEGVLGGYVTNGFSQGKEAANLAAQILHGNSPLAIPLIKESTNQYMFNYPQLKRLGVSISQLPEKSVILNRPLSFYDHYKYRIWLIVSFLIFQTFIIITLIQTIQKRKNAETSLQKATNELERKVKERTLELAETNTSLKKEISERKQAEESIKKASIEWSTAMDASADAIYLLSPNRHILQANRVFYLVTGSSPQTAIGQHIESIIHPQGEEVPCSVCLAQEEKRDEVIIMEPDDSDNPTGNPIEITVRIVKDEEGQPISIFMRLHDLTEQRKIENALRNSAREWEKTFDSMTDIITLQDKDMRIVRANKTAYDVFQAKPGELTGRYCYKLFQDSNTPCSLCPEPLSNIPGETPGVIITHEKLGKIFHVTCYPILDDNKEYTHIVLIAKDITEQKRVEEELFQAHKMEAIGTLAGGIAHDFNNILSAIMGYAEMAKINILNNNNATDDIDQIIKSSNRAAELVRHILTFSRKSDHSLESLTPHLIINEALKMLRASLPTTIEIHENIDSKCGNIMADETNIHQIIVNLCTNALHAMENEKGILSISLYRKEISAEEIIGESEVTAGPYIVFEVSDTGLGMDQATIDRIFDPYYTTKEVGKGTGLGLSVIHGIIQDYHGFIRVDSDPGKGTTFRVHIPVAQQEISTPDKSEIDEPLPTGTEKILVVDDESIIATMNKTMLEQLGYQATAITQSIEALEQIRTDPDQFDLIITDQTMPDLTGAELAKEVLSIKPDMPIILCTGYSAVLSQEDALAIGIKKYTRKPVDITTLAKMVRQILDEN